MPRGLARRPAWRLPRHAPGGAFPGLPAAPPAVAAAAAPQQPPASQEPEEKKAPVGSVERSSGQLAPRYGSGSQLLTRSGSGELQPPAASRCCARSSLRAPSRGDPPLRGRNASGLPPGVRSAAIKASRTLRGAQREARAEARSPVAGRDRRVARARAASRVAACRPRWPGNSARLGHRHAAWRARGRARRRSARATRARLPSDRLRRRLRARPYQPLALRCSAHALRADPLSPTAHSGSQLATQYPHEGPKRGVAAGRSAQRGTSGAATGGGGLQAPPTRTGT